MKVTTGRHLQNLPSSPIANPAPGGGAGNSTVKTPVDVYRWLQEHNLHPLCSLLEEAVLPFKKSRLQSFKACENLSKRL
jgi:hypothetical protein